METIKVTGLTSKEVRLRNYIFEEVLSGLGNYEDMGSFEEYEYGFEYGHEMERNDVVEWAKELGWTPRTTKGVLGSLIKKNIFRFVGGHDGDCDIITTNSPQGNSNVTDYNGWFDYSKDGETGYLWELK